jgi:Family of unknown function (DUF5990)
MEFNLNLRIVLERPPSDVVFGLQVGAGTDYETIQKQQSDGRDLAFDCSVRVRNNRADGVPNFLGPLTQGPPSARFIYVDVGTYAGQADSCWSRRMKIPLEMIGLETIKQASKDPKLMLEARIRGTGRDGGPSCGSVRPAQGWKLVRSS